MYRLTLQQSTLYSDEVHATHTPLLYTLTAYTRCYFGGSASTLRRHRRSTLGRSGGGGGARNLGHRRRRDGRSSTKLGLNNGSQDGGDTREFCVPRRHRPIVSQVSAQWNPFTCKSAAYHVCVPVTSYSRTKARVAGVLAFSGCGMSSGGSL